MSSPDSDESLAYYPSADSSDEHSIASSESLTPIAPASGENSPFVCRCSQVFRSNSNAASTYYQHISGQCGSVTFESLVTQNLPVDWAEPVKCKKCSRVFCSKGAGMASHARACLRTASGNDQADYTLDNLWQKVQQPNGRPNPRVAQQGAAVEPRTNAWIREHAPSAEQRTKLEAIQSDLTEGCFTLHYRSVDSMRALVYKLLTTITDDESSDPAKVISTHALLCLPGLITRLQRINTTSATMTRLLTTDWPGAPCSASAILDSADATLTQHPRRRVTGRGPVPKERLKEMVSSSRLGALTRVIDREASNESWAPLSKDDTIAAVQSLHPEANDDDNLEPFECTNGLNPTVFFNAASIAKEVDRLPKGTAPGASGWTNLLLKQMFGAEARALLTSLLRPTNGAPAAAPPSTPGLDLLAKLFANIFTDSLPRESHDLMNTARLVLIPKPGRPTDLRPIAIQECILRLMLRAVNAHFAPIVGKKLAPLQLAVGISGGTEILATIADHAYSDGLAVASLDFAKAYQSIRRGAIAKGLQEYCPDLLPLFKSLYGKSSNLRANTADERGALVGQSSTGCKQGDPLSTLLFCIGIQAALLEIQAKGNDLLATGNLGDVLYLIGYADDLQLIGSPRLVQRVANRAAEVFERFGLAFNKAKSKVLVKDLPESRSSTDLVYVQGNVIVGVPIGSDDYITRECTERIEAMSTSAPSVGLRQDLSLQVKFAILTKVVNARPAYLSRNVAPRLTEAPLASFDAAIQSAVEDIVGSALTGSSRALLRLPISDGGCGLRAHAGNESIHAFNQRVELVKPFLVSHHVSIARTISNTGALTFPSPASTGQDSQVTSIKEVHQHTLTRVLTQLETEDAGKAAYVRSGSTQSSDDWIISGKWLTWHGGPDWRQRMLDDAFGTALRFRLTLSDHNSDLACPYGDRHGDHEVNLRSSFMHLVRCHPNKHGLMKKRHNRVRDLLYQLLVDTLLASEPILPEHDNATEQVVQQASDTTRQITADIMVYTNIREHNQTRLVFDVSIVEPTNRHGCSSARGSAAAHQERAKRDLYRPVSDADASTTFIPFILESNGFVGADASAFLTSIVDKGNSGTKKRIQSFLADVSYSVAKDTGWAASRARQEAVSNQLAPPPAE